MRVKLVRNRRPRRCARATDGRFAESVVRGPPTSWRHSEATTMADIFYFYSSERL